MHTLEPMTTAEILAHRLHNQRLLGERRQTPADVVRWLGAVQAQDYPGSLWAVCLRAGDGGEEAVEKAVRDRRIVRTWPMRGTLHFVPAPDARWMLALLGRRPVARAAAMHRRMGIDAATVSRAARVANRALHGGKHLARGALYRLFASARLPVDGQRGIHILWLLAHRGLICFGPRAGTEHTFALMEEWLPEAPTPARDVALATLAERYFASHGPATVRDFAWWSGLPVTEAREGLELVKSRLTGAGSNGDRLWMTPSSARPAPGGTLLLPAFDEYMVGYTDRGAPLERSRSREIPVTMAQALSPVIVRDGMVIGTWKRTRRKDRVIVTPRFFVTGSRRDRRAFDEAAELYGRSIGLPVTVSE